MFRILEGFYKDQQDQMDFGGRIKKISVNTLQLHLAESNPDMNKSALSQGKSYGRKIVNGEELPKTAALTTGKSLEIVAGAILEMDEYQWPAVRKAVNEAGPDYAYLLDEAPESVGNDLQSIQSLRVGDICNQYPGLPINEALVEFSEKIKVLE